MPNAASSPIDRRTAVQRLAAVAGSALLARPVVDGTAAPVAPGVQLYTVRSEMEKGVDRTLARIATIGYREVEFAGYFGKKPAEIAQWLKANGLSAPSAHVERDDMGKAWGRVLDEAATIGHRWVVVAWVPDKDRGSADAYRRLAAEFNAAGAAAKARGLSFAYHNHDFEFTPLGGTNGHEVLLRECDPALVQFELDLYWTTKAKVDPVAYVARHAQRFPLVHVKDMTPAGAMTEVGAGTIPFQKIFDAANGGIRHFFVEHDEPRVPFESVTQSLAALRRYTT